MDNFDENDFNELYNENDLGSSYDRFNNGFNNAFQNNSDRQKDISSINDRTGKNQEIRNTDEDYGNTSSKNKRQKKEDENSDDITGSRKGKGSDELESTKSESDKENSKKSKNFDDSSSDKKDDKKDNKNSEIKKENDKEKNKEKDKDKKSDDSKGGFFKNKLLKYKIYFTVAGIAIIAFVIAFLFLAIISAVESLTLGLTSFFGVPESTSPETGNIPGLYSDDRYIYDEDGNPMNREQLIAYLEKNSTCESNLWTNISDGWNELWGGKIGDVCQLIRVIKDKTKDTGVDEALIISTIFYGYDTRPAASQYKNQADVPYETETTQHFQSLLEVLNDKNTNITSQEIDNIIKNAHAKATSYYYVWKIEEDKDSNGNVTNITGKCEYKEAISDNYNLDKWKVYMRFGEEVASKFDDVVLKAKNFESSSDECKNADGIYTNEKLKEQLSRAAANYGSDVSYKLDTESIKKARKDLDEVDAKNSDLFYQAADIESKTKDTFESYDGITFDYKNGYAYQNFPSFGPSMEEYGPYYGKVNITYDDVFTPKEVESLIQSIIGKKKNVNSALLRDDPDIEKDYNSGLEGYTGVPTGANCMPYLTASLSELQVELTDCYGAYMDTVNFEDYIIGVANGEVSNKNDDYVLAQMVAAISYSLNRHNNYTKGNKITMRSGTCDQVYCSMMRGCHSKKTPVGSCDICATFYIGGSKAYPDLYSKYQALYEIASDYLLVKDDKPFSAHYVSTSQNRWYEKASKGMSFTQIMQEEYQDEGATLIRCSDGDSKVENPDVPQPDTNKVGNKATDEYPKVSPNLGNYYGFSYKDGNDSTHITINPEWKDANIVTISPKCDGNAEYSQKTYTVHKSAVPNFEKAFKKVCKILTNGVKIKDGSTCKYTASDIADGTVFIERKTSSGTFDLHAYGIAQDLNYSKKININGKDYTPYNTRELSDYLEFVNAIGGEEENCKNINYILWAYAYKDAGFYWGGNYGRNGNSGSYDGKLFELKYE